MLGALPAMVYGAGLVFCRVGALLMLIPGVGETNVPTNIRLAFALILSLAFYPLLRAGLPPIPATVGGLGAQIGVEVLIGVAIGALLRMFLGALAVLGETVSLSTTLSFAQTANPLEAQPGSTLATFLSVTAMAVIFTTNLDHMFIAAIARSYSLFPPQKPPALNDATLVLIKAMSNAFALGLQLSSPVIVFSLVLNVATGMIGRLIPQFQIFFAAAPLQVLFGLSVFMTSFGMVIMVWMEHYESFLAQFT